MSLKRVGILDYGMGNLHSIYHAFDYAGAKVEFIETNRSTSDVDYLILPGVGAFHCGMQSLITSSLQHYIHKFIETGKPMMGICLGMQMLFSQSEEFQLTNGLELLKGKVTLITEDENTRLPYVGWSSLTPQNDNSKILKGISPTNDFYYFVHSYSVKPDHKEDIGSITTYNDHNIVASIEKDNIFGCQFHPEKSSSSGMKVIQNFLSL